MCFYASVSNPKNYYYLRIYGICYIFMSLSAIAQIRFFRKVIFMLGNNPISVLDYIVSSMMCNKKLLYYWWLLKAGY